MSLDAEIKFSFKFLELLNVLNKPAIFSPASILGGLSMIFPGAKGETAKEMAEIIGDDKNDHEILEHYSQFVKLHQNHDDGSVKINVANQLFVSKNINLMPEFNQLIINYFDSEIKKMDFDNADETSKEINKFILKKTNGQIKSITKPSDIKKNLCVILVNAIHFSAQWKNIFCSRKKQTFNSFDSSREIDMMDRSVMRDCEWNFNENEFCEVVGIPYKNGKAWMYIVLPKEKQGLTKLLQNLSPSDFHQWTKRNKNPYLHVQLPIMDFSNDFELIEKLQKLGMNTAFEDSCNLSGMISNPSKLEKIVHKAVIKVDEFGTEASAATEIYDLMRCGPRNFIVNHPFLFFITTNNPEDSKPLNILFIGTFC